MKKKDAEKKINTINKKLMALSKEMKELHKKKNKLVAKLKKVKKSSTRKIMSKESEIVPETNGNGGAEVQAQVTTTEPTQPH
jgi:predicted transcriptional regulator